MSVERNEDTALVARIARGDRSAVEQLYRRHALWLTKRLTSRCSDPDLVDIAVQDTFVAVWKSAKKYRGDGDVGAWIWGIAVRRLIDQMRKRRPMPMEFPFARSPAGSSLAGDAASSTSCRLKSSCSETAPTGSSALRFANSTPISERSSS